jgi:peptide/nickel transport system substrate-binding protein
VTSRPYLETFKGFRFVDDDTIEVYVDYWHFDDDYIGSYASPADFDMPWELKAAMDDLVFEQRRAAYSDTAGVRFNVPWLSLVLRQDAGLVDRTLRDMERDEVIPAGLEVGGRSLVTPDEAVARYEAAQEWYDDKDHLVISNGPFYLEQFGSTANFAELHAFRDPTYPFKPGDNYRGAPPELSIGDVPSDLTVVPGEDLELTVTVSGPGTQRLHYILVDPAAGEVVVTGVSENDLDDDFSLSLGGDVTQNLFPGFYELYLAAESDALAQITERRVDLEVLP